VTEPGPEGLPAERTALAWSRTSLAVLVNGVLLVVKQPHHDDGPLRPAAAALAAIIAIAVYLVGISRQRDLARRPLPKHITARAQVQWIGVAVMVLITATALGLFL